MKTGMTNRAWRGYLALTLVAVAGYFLTPNDTWIQTIYAELVGLLATGAIVVGVVRHRPAAKAAWLWFAVGQLLNVLGTLAEAVIGRVLHLETWPSVADVLWLGLYPGLVIGLYLFDDRALLGLAPPMLTQRLKGGRVEGEGTPAAGRLGAGLMEWQPTAQRSCVCAGRCGP